jgi:protein-arginine kinase activator protein McsA
MTQQKSDKGTIDLPDDNKFDHACHNCGREFEVVVEFYPSIYSGGKIECIKCEKCDTEIRDPAKRENTYAFPKSVHEAVVCRPCFRKGHQEDFETSKLRE